MYLLIFESIKNELVTAGVLKQDIILGFHAPYKWKFTELADYVK
ncbi:element excision factor XisI family protein [Nostoc sp.]